MNPVKMRRQMGLMDILVVELTEDRQEFQEDEELVRELLPLSHVSDCHVIAEWVLSWWMAMLGRLICRDSCCCCKNSTGYWVIGWWVL